MNYWDPQARWLDGPTLVLWLEPLVPATQHQSEWPEHLRRRFREWRDGGLVDLYALDRYLCLMGMHASDVPDDCWSDARPDRRPMACR